jgi:hypothetical protein
MKISIITITCRANPRLEEMARCLNATFNKVGGLALEWIIVDELHATRDHSAIIDIVCPLDHDGTSLRSVKFFPPPATVHRTSSDKAVAHNTARNAGLADATGDYIVFLNDCNMVTVDLASVLRDCAKEGLGIKIKMQSLVDMKIPDDGIIRRGHHDLLRNVPVLAAASACWGAPKQAFDAIHGFDLSYDGERYGNDLDAIVRLSRVGVRFVSTERAYTLQLRRTKIDNEITTRKDVYAGARNKKLFANLQSDKHRVLPIWEYGQPQPVAVDTGKPVKVVRQPRPAPAPRIVQCPAPRAATTAPGRNDAKVAKARPLAPKPLVTESPGKRLQRKASQASKAKAADRFECAGECGEGVVVPADDEGMCTQCGGPCNIFENNVLIAGPDAHGTGNGVDNAFDVAALEGDELVTDDLGLD